MSVLPRSAMGIGESASSFKFSASAEEEERRNVRRSITLLYTFSERYTASSMAEQPEDLIAAGYLARRQDNSIEAKRLFAEAVDVSQGSDNRLVLARALTGLGQIERDLDNSDSARQNYQTAVEILRTLDDPLRLAHTIRHLADILRGQSRSEEAIRYYEEALAIYRGQHSTGILDLANTVAGYARCRDVLGDKSAAEILWREARSLYGSLNIEAGIKETEMRLATLGQRS